MYLKLCTNGYNKLALMYNAMSSSFSMHVFLSSSLVTARRNQVHLAYVVIPKYIIKVRFVLCPNDKPSA